MKPIYAALIAFACAACAKSPDSISASYSDGAQFSRSGCAQLNADNRRLSTEYSQLASAQDQARTNDSFGVALLGLPVSSMTGGDKAAEIARVKGDQEAVRRTMVAKKCTLT